MEKETNSTRNGSGRWIGKVAIGIAAFWIVSIIALEILLSTPLLTNTVNRIASQYIDGSIPEALLEAARIDGATEWQIFKNIELPVLKDIKIGFIILSVVFSILCLIGIVCSFLIKNGIYVLIIFLHYKLLLLFIVLSHITK